MGIHVFVVICQRDRRDLCGTSSSRADAQGFREGRKPAQLDAYPSRISRNPQSRSAPSRDSRMVDSGAHERSSVGGTKWKLWVTGRPRWRSGVAFAGQTRARSDDESEDHPPGDGGPAERRAAQKSIERRIGRSDRGGCARAPFHRICVWAPMPRALRGTRRRCNAAASPRTDPPRGQRRAAGPDGGRSAYADTGMRRGLAFSTLGSSTSRTPFCRRAEMWSRSNCSAVLRENRRR